jgi:5,10-methylenetetrahydromethanopterin reductase
MTAPTSTPPTPPPDDARRPSPAVDPTVREIAELVRSTRRAVPAGRPPIREGWSSSGTPSRRGFDAVWQADSRLVRDAVVPMAAFAASPSGSRSARRRRLLDPQPGPPRATFSTLDDLAPGRIILGHRRLVGPAGQKVGISGTSRCTVMREVVTAVRALLANETVTFDGEFVHLDGVELDYVYQERRPKDVPIYIGATGMQMMELTGEIADGVVLNYLVSPDYNAGDGALERGAAKAGSHASTTSTAAARGVLVDTRPPGRARRARLLVTQYLGQQPHIMKASGVPQELLDEIGQVLTWPATHDRSRRRRSSCPTRSCR